MLAEFEIVSLGFTSPLQVSGAACCAPAGRDCPGAYRRTQGGGGLSLRLTPPRFLRRDLLRRAGARAGPPRRGDGARGRAGAPPGRRAPSGPPAAVQTLSLCGRGGGWSQALWAQGAPPSLTLFSCAPRCSARAQALALGRKGLAGGGAGSRRALLQRWAGDAGAAAGHGGARDAPDGAGLWVGTLGRGGASLGDRSGAAPQQQQRPHRLLLSAQGREELSQGGAAGLRWLQAVRSYGRRDGGRE